LLSTADIGLIFSVRNRNGFVTFEYGEVERKVFSGDLDLVSLFLGVRYCCSYKGYSLPSNYIIVANWYEIWYLHIFLNSF